MALGIHPRTLYQMRDDSIVESVSRGVYRLASLPPLGEPDLATVALRVPRAVVCLVSALSYHQITTQVPREVQIALPRGTKSDSPVSADRVFRLSGAALTAGIETHRIDGIPVRIYGRRRRLPTVSGFETRSARTSLSKPFNSPSGTNAFLLLRFSGTLGSVEWRSRAPYLEALQ
jgi:hypothetical protein